MIPRKRGKEKKRERERERGVRKRVRGQTVRYKKGGAGERGRDDICLGTYSNYSNTEKEYCNTLKNLFYSQVDLNV